MSMVDLVMPKLGESIMEATILKWLKKPGDMVEEDETILEIATDKVDSEVPSTAKGIISEILFNENDVVPIGRVIARINTETEVEANSTTPINDKPSPAYQSEAYEEASLVEHIPYQPSEKTIQPGSSNGIRFYSPLVLNIASSEGISMHELEQIGGTGQDGRVSKKDIISYLENRKNKPPQKPLQADIRPAVHEVPAVAQKQEFSSPAVFTGNVEIIEMDRMRKMIAKHMIDSQNISAHVTSFAECDVTNLVLWRERIKKEFEKREGEK